MIHCNMPSSMHYILHCMMNIYIYIYMYIYISYILLCTPLLRAVRHCGSYGGPWTANLDCPSGLLGLPGPLYCLSGPLYCLSWPSGRQLDASWTPVGRQLDASWTPSGRQVDAKWAPNWTPQRLPVSTYALRAPKQLPSPTERLASSAFVAGWRHMQH